MVPEIDTFIENLNSVGYLLKRTKDIPGMMAFSLPGLIWFVWLQFRISLIHLYFFDALHVVSMCLSVYCTISL